MPCWPAARSKLHAWPCHTTAAGRKRLANCNSAEAIDDLQEELIDRFGKLPDPARALIETHRLRIAAKPLGIVKIDAHAESALLQFAPNPPVDAMRIIELIQKNRHIKLVGNEKLRIERELPDPKARAQMVRDVLRSLGQPLKPAEAAAT